MFGLNVPRTVVSAVRQGTVAALPPDERAMVPPQVDTSSEEHRQLFHSYFDADDPLHGSLPPAQMEAMFAAQATWDAVMAHNIGRVLPRMAGERPMLVVLVGSGHVAYGLGIERQAAAQGLKLRFASVVPLALADRSGDPVGPVRASYADYLWGLPPDGPPLYPELGASTVEADRSAGDLRRKVIDVPRDTPAAGAGVEVGDLLLALDDVPLPDREALQRAIAAHRWGDRATLAVDRGGVRKVLEVWFRRTLPEKGGGG